MDQLNETMQKFGQTYDVIIGGDMNENLVRRAGTPRVKALQEFMIDNNFCTQETAIT